jgi:hypothetical protein
MRCPSEFLPITKDIFHKLTEIDTDTWDFHLQVQKLANFHCPSADPQMHTFGGSTKSR